MHPVSNASSIPYRLRPNKAVDRELFLSLLVRLAATLRLDDYRYVGLGGPFLDDFRLIHGRLGITKLVSIESEEGVHRRQLFNRPVAIVECVHSTLDDYLDSSYFDEPTIIWLDYTDPRFVSDQIERFARTIGEVPHGSVLRITLNANPTSLGKPDATNSAVEAGALGRSSLQSPSVQEWRLARFRARMGYLFPSGLGPDGMTSRNFGRSLLEAVRLAVEREILSHSDRRVSWCLATHYADGQPMATATLIVRENEKTGDEVDRLLHEWEFHSTPSAPWLLDMPALSALERLTLESGSDGEFPLGYELPKSSMGADPFETFRKFYRVFPHFSRVEI